MVTIENSNKIQFVCLWLWMVFIHVVTLIVIIGSITPTPYLMSHICHWFDGTWGHWRLRGHHCCSLVTPPLKLERRETNCRDTVCHWVGATRVTCWLFQHSNTTELRPGRAWCLQMARTAQSGSSAGGRRNAFKWGMGLSQFQSCVVSY